MDVDAQVTWMAKATAKPSKSPTWLLEPKWLLDQQWKPKCNCNSEVKRKIRNCHQTAALILGTLPLDSHSQQLNPFRKKEAKIISHNTMTRKTCTSIKTQKPTHTHTTDSLWEHLIGWPHPSGRLTHTLTCNQLILQCTLTSATSLACVCVLSDVQGHALTAAQRARMYVRACVHAPTHVCESMRDSSHTRHAWHARHALFHTPEQSGAYV